MSGIEKRDLERLRAAAEHLDAFGASEYRRGFDDALKLAELALRWMQSQRTISKASMADALAKNIREACAEAGVDVPAEASKR